MNIAGGTVATEDMLLTKIESGIYMPAECKQLSKARIIP